MTRGIRLFATYDLRHVLEENRQKAEQKIATLAAHADLLPQAEAEVLKRLWTEYRVNPLDLVSDGVSVEQDDAQVDVSHDRSRDFRNPGPHYIPGQRVRYYVAYKGDKPLWECRPSSFTLNTPVAAEVTDNELVFEFLVAGTDIADTKLEFDEQLRRVRDYLIWSRKDVDQDNEALMPAFRDALARRRAEVEKTREGIGGGCQAAQSCQRARVLRPL